MKPEDPPILRDLVRSKVSIETLTTAAQGNQITLPFRTAIDVYANNRNEASLAGVGALVEVFAINDLTVSRIASGRIILGNTRVAVGRAQGARQLEVRIGTDPLFPTVPLGAGDTPLLIDAVGYNCYCSSTGADLGDTILAGGASTIVTGVITRIVAVGGIRSSITANGVVLPVGLGLEKIPVYGSLVNPIVTTSAGITSARFERTT